jgi:ABC-2 type transport system permease protein
MSKISTLNNDFFNQTDRRKKSKKSFSILSNIVCKTQQEKALFEFTWKMSARDNSFLLQFLPSLAYMIFFAFLFTFKMKSSFSEAMAEMPLTDNYLWFIYLPLLGVSNSLYMISFSNSHESSWIYLW